MKTSKIKLLFSTIIMFFIFPAICLGQYFVNDYEIKKLTEEDIKGDANNYCKVVFNGNSALNIASKTMYVEKNTILTLEDAPKVSYSDGYINWTAGNLVLSINNALNSEISVTEDLTFAPTPVAYTESTNTNDVLVFSKENTDYRGSASSTGEESGRQKLTVSEGSNTSGNLVNYGEINSQIKVLKDVKIELKVNINGSEKESSDWGGNREDAVNNDTTISLEDKNSNSSDYKPLAGSSSKNVNYCANRINLSSDLLLLNSYISIGARNGGYGNNPDFFQYNYQNFIVGQYSEIDLCGHYLIIGQKSEIWAVGSITNSIPERGGLIVESGGNLETTFVVEDHHHERSLPITYLHGDAAFAMYRCPYFDVKTIFYPGCSYQYGLNMFFGPSQGSVYSEINVIGGDNPIYSFNSGYIVRDCRYDNELKQVVNGKNSNFAINNLMYQKISYSFYNCNGLQINLPTIKASISIADLNIVLGKENFYIPPYLSFYLFNSKLTIYNKFVFLPGSYLYVDELSNIEFSFKDVQVNEQSFPISLQSFCYQNKGSLEFLSTIHDLSEATSKRVDDTDANGGGGSAGNSRNIIFTNSDFYRSYLSQNCPAHCDLYGTVSFNKNTSNLVDNYTLGGLVNIYDIESFYNSVNGFDRINFYVNNIFSAAANFDRLDINNYRFNIFQFNFIPLISFGYVITNPNSPQTILDSSNLNHYVFDSETGLIKSKDSSEIYAFVLSNENNDHLNRSGYTDSVIHGDREFRNGSTNLEGNIYRVNYISEHCSIASGSFQGEYVYFHGKFVQASSITGSKSANNLTGNLNLTKFRVRGKYGGDMSSRAAYFGNSDYYGHDAWRLS